MTTQIKTAQNTAMFSGKGQGVVNGYAIGRAVIMGATSLEVPHYRIANDAVQSECERLYQAMDQARNDIQHLIATLPADAPKEMAGLLGVHALLLDDTLLRSQTAELIQQRFYNAEWALTTQSQILLERFSAMQDEYLRERGSDVRQVIERVVGLLSGNHRSVPEPDWGDGELAEALIVVARDIAPDDMLALRGAKFAAFLTDLGGPTSHTAIVARSLNVPAVVGLGGFRTLVREGDLLIVDGFTGVVMVNPPERVLNEYQTRQREFRDARAKLESLRNSSAITLDGVPVHLEANIELPEEAVEAYEAGADGIGLFRSEFLFMGRQLLPSEEEQFEAYRTVLETMRASPLPSVLLISGQIKY